MTLSNAGIFTIVETSESVVKLKSGAVFIKKQISEMQALKMAVKAVIHDALFRVCRYMINQDTISEANLDNLNHLYAGYKALKMNGTGEKMYNEVLKKKVVTE